MLSTYSLPLFCSEEKIVPERNEEEIVPERSEEEIFPEHASTHT